MRSSSWARAAGAMGVTLALQLWLALTASASAAILGGVLDRRMLPVGDVSAALELLARSPDLAWTSLAVAVAALLLHGLTLPALQVTWLYALAHGQSVGPSLRFALTHYGAAVRQSAVVVAVGLAGAAALATLPVWLRDTMARSPEPQQRLALGLSLVPLGSWALWCALWHDLARAQLATHGGSSVRSTLREWPMALRPSRFAGFLLYLAVSTPLLAVAPLVYRWSLDLTGLAMAQGLLLLRALARSVWLARATQLAEARTPR